jgi:hypothetical protein
MAPTKKSRETVQASASASSASSSAETPAPAPVKSKKSKVAAAPAPAAASPKKRGKKSADAPAAPAKERERKVIYVPVFGEDGVPSWEVLPEEPTAEQLFEYNQKFTNMLRVLTSSHNALHAQMNSLYKRTLREGNRRKNKRTVDPNKEKKLGTFTFRYRVRPELIAFMGLPKGSYVSRVDATEAVNNYINAQNLKITEGDDKGSIRVDKALKKVFSATAEKKDKEGAVVTTYTKVNSKNLQAWLAHNYFERAPDSEQPTIEEVTAAQQRRSQAKDARKAKASGSAAPAATSASATGEKKKRRSKKGSAESDDE